MRAVTIRRVHVDHEVEASLETFGGTRVLNGPEETNVRVTVHGLTAVEAAHMRDELHEMVEQHVDRARERPRTTEQ